jgi:hypothetical protein
LEIVAVKKPGKITHTGGRAGKLRASSTWSAESLIGRDERVERKFWANTVSDMVRIG